MFDSHQNHFYLNKELKCLTHFIQLNLSRKYKFDFNITVSTMSYYRKDNRENFIKTNINIELFCWHTYIVYKTYSI